MENKEYVKESREEKRQLFGALGLHDDCIHYGAFNGKPFCNACTHYADGHRYRQDNNVLRCQKEMCYFYEPRRMENTDDQ